MSNIKEHTSESLAAKVVCYRVLKINKEAAKEAMIELESRKINGDEFDYKSYINQKIKEMPSPTVGTDQIDALKKTLRNIKDGNI